METPPTHGYGREGVSGLPAPVPLVTDPRHRPRRWAAALLSLFTAGLGHVYVGAWRRGAKLVAALMALGVLGAWLAPRAPLWLSLLLVFAAGAARLVTAFDVLRLPDRDLRARTAGRTALEVLGGWVALAAVAVAVSLSLRALLLESFKIPAGSMRPTIEVGDQLFVDKRNKVADRGQMMVFEFPEDRTYDFIKRIVALGGDVVEIDDQGWLSVNGLRAPTCKVGELPDSTDEEGHPRPAQLLWVEFLDGHPHLIARERSFHGGASHFGPFTVPPGSVFVLGDNRDNSHDSRGWNNGQGRGVPLDHFKGVPFGVWASFGAGGRVAWERFGRLDAPRLPGNPALAPALARCLASAPPSAVPAPGR